jgi:hypothetical protein
MGDGIRDLIQRERRTGKKGEVRSAPHIRTHTAVAAVQPQGLTEVVVCVREREGCVCE